MAGSITPYQTAQGKRWRVRYRKPDKSQTDKRGFKTKRDAELFLASVTVSKAKGDYLDPSAGRRTVSSFAEQWKRGRLARLKPSSQNTLETTWRVHVEPRWGDRGVATIRPSEVEDWISELCERLGAQSVRRAVFVLSGVLAIAERDGIISKVPSRGLEMPAKPKKEPRFLSHAQVELLVASTVEQHRTLAYTLAYCGPRWGEAVALRVRHLNMLRRRIRIVDNAVLVKGQYVVGTTKSGQARDTAIPAFLLPHLAKACEGKGPDDLVFGDGRTHVLYPHRTSGWFARAVRAAQAADPSFPRITEHDLRHTAASLAIQSGANVKVVQQMLGHASASVTLDVYGHLFDIDLDVIADRMDSARKAALA
ncbi:tyrosine-type recombinase/integrase [Microbacterium sp. NPDC080220]|uniref:tyrosine-type recombinase/integrase n=1 Tax=Microbacterium sp. NPDC080220 TaxID=3161017 RepID=UPI003416ADFD